LKILPSPADGYVNHYQALENFQGIVITHMVKIFFNMIMFNEQTLRLLNSSTAVAIGGAVRLHIAFLLAGISAMIPIYGAFALIVYATYTLDRSIGCAEDAINNPGQCGADHKFGLAAAVAAFCAGLYLFIQEGIFLAPLLPLFIGFLYTRGIRIGSGTFTLKGSCGGKNSVIGLTWGGTIALITSHWCFSTATLAVIFIFYFSKMFVNSVVFDFKDIRGDRAAGIRTLPVWIGETSTRAVLIVIILGLHIFMISALIAGFIRSEWVILLYGLCIPSSFLLFYSSSFEAQAGNIGRRLREIVIIGEPALSLVARSCTGVLI
jgi:4-hydroxybenzoate polyprenyltransferase